MVDSKITVHHGRYIMEADSLRIFIKYAALRQLRLRGWDFWIACCRRQMVIIDNSMAYATKFSCVNL